MSGLRVGFGRASITVYAEGACMFGWGHPENVSRGVLAPLFARAMAASSEERTLVYVCCDLGMISESVRLHVLERVQGLGVDEASLMISATHTHSGPTGYSTYLFYASAGPGFYPEVHDGIVDGIVEAITQAHSRMEPARLFVGREPIAEDVPVAFNRNVASHRRNREVGEVASSAAAIDRRMTVFFAQSEAGRALGLLSLFGVHATSVHREATALHPDHKGEASRACEREEAARGNANFVAIFAQTVAGDVTPNDVWDASRGVMAGPGKDDLESASMLGALQAEHAWRIAQAARERRSEVRGALRCGVRYVDLARAEVAPRFAEGEMGRTTGAPELGVPFAIGTAEGPGPLHPLRAPIGWLQRRSGRGAKGEGPQGNKRSLAELGRGTAGRVFGVLPLRASLLRALPDPFVRYLAAALRGPSGQRSYVPTTLPVQVLGFGSWVIAGLPLEPTTQAGRRLAAALAEALGQDESRVVACGYTNAYASYLATPEEFDAQSYEGAASMFGRYAQPALSTALAALGEALRERARVVQGSAPRIVPPSERPPPTECRVVRWTAREVEAHEAREAHAAREADAAHDRASRVRAASPRGA